MFSLAQVTSPCPSPDASPEVNSMFGDMKIIISLLLLLVAAAVAFDPFAAVRITADTGASIFNLIWNAGGSVVSFATRLFR